MAADAAGAAGAADRRWEQTMNAARDPSGVWSWDEVFMCEAHILKRRSKDPCTQVGAVIIDSTKRPVGNGYNGMPCGKDTLPWGKEMHLEEHEKKYAYVVHAEVNAVLNSSSIAGLRGATIYATRQPCCECAKVIAQCGIVEVVYDEGHADLAAERIFAECGIRMRQYIPLHETHAMSSSRTTS